MPVRHKVEKVFRSLWAIHDFSQLRRGCAARTPTLAAKVGNVSLPNSTQTGAIPAVREHCYGRLSRSLTSLYCELFDSSRPTY